EGRDREPPADGRGGAHHESVVELAHPLGAGPEGEDTGDRHEHPDHDVDPLKRRAAEAVGEDPQPQSEKFCNHSMSSTAASPPASSTKRSSRLRPSSTSARGPAASTAPSAMMATPSQTRSVSSMLWLERMTVPPAAANRLSTSITTAADTGSTASNGSASTTRRGARVMAAAIAAFVVVPAE